MLAVLWQPSEGQTPESRGTRACRSLAGGGEIQSPRHIPGRTRHWSRQGKPETVGVRANLMKLVAVTQWVRAQAQVPPDQSLASRSGVPSTCPPSNGRTELEGTRRQAACSSPARSIVVDERRALKAGAWGKPTGSSGRKAAVRKAEGRAVRTPPGAKSGAGMQRGSSGTWESHVSLWQTPGVGDRVTTGPGVVWGFRPGHAPWRETTHAQPQARYRDASDKRRVRRRARGSLSGA